MWFGDCPILETFPTYSMIKIIMHKTTFAYDLFLLQKDIFSYISDMIKIYLVPNYN